MRLGIGTSRGRPTEAFQHFPVDARTARVVIQQQGSTAGRSAMRSRRCGPVAAELRGEVERAALSSFTFHPDPSADQADQL